MEKDIRGITIGKLAGRCGLSRSTLLYYHSIGLLPPAFHQPGEYRIYSETDAVRLEKICMFRRAGVPLGEIRKILDGSESELTSILRQRFEELSGEISEMHEQQRIIAGMLQNQSLLADSPVMTKKLWVSLLRSAGFSEKDMRKWHITFEKMAPEKHDTFLRHLKIPDNERMEIRSWKNS